MKKIKQKSDKSDKSDRVFKPEIPMTYSEIVEAFNTINSSDAGEFHFA